MGIKGSVPYVWSSVSIVRFWTQTLESEISTLPRSGAWPFCPAWRRSWPWNRFRRWRRRQTWKSRRRIFENSHGLINLILSKTFRTQSNQCLIKLLSCYYLLSWRWIIKNLIKKPTSVHFHFDYPPSASQTMLSRVITFQIDVKRMFWPVTS